MYIGDDHKVCDVSLQIKFKAHLLFQSLLLFVLFCLSHKGHCLSLPQVHLISELSAKRIIMQSNYCDHVEVGIETFEVKEGNLDATNRR